MKRSFISSLRSASFLLAGFVICATAAQAQTADQTLSLSPGWNAVWLEVEPVDGSGVPLPPGTVFTNPSVATVATPKPLAGLSEFFASDPGAITTFNQEEWQQWKRVDITGTNNLSTITGNRAYLIEVTGGSPVVVNLNGRVQFFRPTWTPDRYNLIGFGLQGTPTFDAFFGPSGGKHPVNKIFTLNSGTGNWDLVTGSSQMASGQAYWVFSAGPSNYMGPVSVDFDMAISGRLDFAGPNDVVVVGSGVSQLMLDLEEIVFSNAGTSATTPELDLITPDAGLGTLSLYVVSPATTGIAYDRGNQVDSAAGAGASSALGETVGSANTVVLSLGAQRNWNDGNPRTNLYRLNTGTNGASFWLPITASPNLVAQPTVTGPLPPGAGLWVGEVIFDSATSIVEDGSPVRPASGSSPMRMIIHSDGTTVKLLSQVTFMKTKTADAGIAPSPVLVVDQAKIPFFEGVKERNGNKVGIRIEAVAYDMPRKLDAGSQDALIEDPKFLLLTTLSQELQTALGKDPSIRTQTEKDLIASPSSTTAINNAKASIPSLLPNYLLSSGGRPPKLVEVYDLSVDMSGIVGAGQILTGNVSLDPFHRSNPFRHAYHKDLAKGPQINRTFSVTFDAEQPVAGMLRGTCTETITGLIKTNLTLTGRVTFGRVSTVDTLN